MRHYTSDRIFLATHGSYGWGGDRSDGAVWHYCCCRSCSAVAAPRLGGRSRIRAMAHQAPHVLVRLRVETQKHFREVAAAHRAGVEERRVQLEADRTQAMAETHPRRPRPRGARANASPARRRARVRRATAASALRGRGPHRRLELRYSRAPARSKVDRFKDWICEQLR